MGEMTSKERMRVALERGKPDRVPISVVADCDYMCEAAGSDLREFYYGDAETLAEINRRFLERHPQNDFLLAYSGVHRRTSAVWQLTQEGDRFFLVERETGAREELPPASTGAPPGAEPTSAGLDDPITCEADIARVVGETPTVAEVGESGVLDTLALTLQQAGDRAFVAYPCGNVFPTVIRYLGGFERAMETIARDPMLVAAVAEALAWHRVANIRAAAQIGPDAIWLHAYLEGADLVSPDHWRQIMQPVHSLLAREAREAGMKALMWFLGDCMPLLEDIVQTGVDGLVVEQSRRAYGSDPGEIRKVVGQRLCVYGWSPEWAMLRDDRRAITAEVERQVREAGLDGAFVMGTTYLTAEVACETVDFFCDEVLRLNAELAR
jgi:uroporphyrinogen-III decarboxylase